MPNEKSGPDNDTENHRKFIEPFICELYLNQFTLTRPLSKQGIPNNDSQE